MEQMTALDKARAIVAISVNMQTPLRRVSKIAGGVFLTGEECKILALESPYSYDDLLEIFNLPFKEIDSKSDIKFVAEETFGISSPNKPKQLNIKVPSKHFFGMTLEIRDEDVTTISEMLSDYGNSVVIEYVDNESEVNIRLIRVKA